MDPYRMDPTRRDVMTWMTAAAGLGLIGTPALGAVRNGLRDDHETILPWTKLAGEGDAHAWVTKQSVQGGNVAVLSDGMSVIVVDSKFPYFATALREDAITLAAGEGGPKPWVSGGKMSLALIITHHHADHTGGNLAFRKGAFRGDHAASRLVKDVDIIAHTNAAPKIASQVDRYLAALRNGPATVARLPQRAELLPRVTELADRAADLSAEDWAPTAVSGGHWLTWGTIGEDTAGKRSVMAQHFGAGHTDNDFVVFVPELNLVHTGDLIFNGLHPFFDVDAGANSLGWINSLNSIEKLCDDNTTVVPGHGPVGGRKLIGEMRRYLEQLRESVKAEIGKGTSKEDAQAMTFEFMKGRGFDQLRPIAVGAVYDELASE